MISLKEGVRIHGLRNEALFGILVTASVLGNENTVITSVIEGKHSFGSLHYAGQAFDVRSRTLIDPAKSVQELKAALGGDFDVVLESTHIHVEYQPKHSY